MTARGCGAALIVGLIWLGVIALGSAGGAAADGEKRTLPVPAVNIIAGDVIKDEMLEERQFNAGQPNFAVIESRLAVVGQAARRTLIAGYPIPINAVEDVKIVKRGVPVRVVFEDAGLSIVTLGSPLQSAGVGALVRVRNIDTGTIVMGIVQPDGSVRVSNT
jgi:flagella basal body P-ring formation protein FlgA